MLDDVPADALAVLRGSYRPQYAVDAWYDGDLVLEDVPLLSGSLTMDATRAIHAAGTVTAGTPDESLIPTSWAAPLGCYGSELHIRFGVPVPGRDTWWASMGWYRIDTFECGEWWAPYYPARRAATAGLYPGTDTLPGDDVDPAGQGFHYDEDLQLWVCRGTTVTNELSDRWSILDDAKFAVPEQPVSLASVLAEITRLASGLVPVADLTGVTDAPIPTTVTYSDSRTAAIQDLAGVLGMSGRMDRDGALTLVPATPVTGDPVWTVTVGSGDVAALLQWARKGDRSGLGNQVVSSGAASDGAPTQGVATLLTGPLRFGGPFGQVPITRGGPLLTSNAACLADAKAGLVDVGSAQTVQIPLTIPTNPALEAGDTIAAVLPDTTLVGPLLSLAPTVGSGSMQVVMVVSREQLWGIAA